MKSIVLSLLLLLVLSGCSLLGSNQWTAYRVVVEVKTETGVSVINATIESNSIKTQTTDKLGHAELKFRNSGLHVITIKANNKTTKQIKISLPADDNKIVQVILSPSLILEEFELK